MSVTAVPLQPVKASYKIWLWLGILLAVVAAAGIAWVGTAASRAMHLPADQDEQYLAWHKGVAGVVTTESGLQYQVLEPGKGGKPADGDYTMIDLVGHLRDGSVFQPRQTTGMRVGDGIPGFNEALKLMPKNSRYRFWIPADQAYSSPGATPPPMSGIGPKSMLVFDVTMMNFISEAELREIQQRQFEQQMQMQQQMQQGQGEGDGAAPPQGAPQGQ